MQSKIDMYFKSSKLDNHLKVSTTTLDNQTRKRSESGFEGPSDPTEQWKRARVEDRVNSLPDSGIDHNTSTVPNNTELPSTSAGSSCDDSFASNTSHLKSEHNSEILETPVYSEEPEIVTVLLAPNDIISNTVKSKRNKRKAVKNKLPDRDAKVKFIISIIDEYLKKPDTLKHLLNEESHKLLSDWIHLEGKSKRIAALLFWSITNDESQTLETLSNKKSYNFNLEKHRALLLKYEYIESATITLQENQSEFEELTRLISLSQIKKIMTEFKIRFPKCNSKQNAVDELKKYSSKLHRNVVTNKIEKKECIVIKKLQSTIKNCYALSHATRRTFDELVLLMHLGIWSKHGLKHPRRHTNLRPKLQIQGGDINEKYLVDASIQVDNASIVFQTRDEFERFQEAYSLYEKYYQLEDKQAFVLNILELYKAIGEKDMNRYIALPTWLHRYTPAYIYLEILNDGVDQLKYNDEIALKILNTLISQVVFLQHCKAEWYKTKTSILFTLLKKRREEAGPALIEGLEADLPSDTKQILRQYASRILRKELMPNELKIRRVLSEVIEEHDFDKVVFEGYKIRSKTWAEHAMHTSGVGPECYCLKQFIKGPSNDQVFTDGQHWEGGMITTMFFLLFWDIIYTKLIGIAGIFMGRYQQYPLDMFSESFYTNRKQIIDNELKRIEERPIEDILKVMEERWEKGLKYGISDISRKVERHHMAAVLRCLGPRGIAVICRRLARDFGYCYWGFPDITLWNEQTNKVKFVEVKAEKDTLRVNQLQWLHYLKSNDIDVAICRLILVSESNEANDADDDDIVIADDIVEGAPNHNESDDMDEDDLDITR